MSATKTLAQFIVDTRYDGLPTAVVEAAKIAIIDGVANMLAGSTQELATVIGQYVKDSGGTAQASVVKVSTLNSPHSVKIRRREGSRSGLLHCLCTAAPSTVGESRVYRNAPVTWQAAKPMNITLNDVTALSPKVS